MMLLTKVSRPALAFALVMASAPALGGKTLLKVCVLAALSGPAASLLGAIDVGRDQYKTDHPNSVVEVILKDTQGRPDVASAIAQEAISKEGCQIVGALLSSEARLVADVVRNNNKTLYVETVARTTLPDHRLMFRLSSTLHQEARGAARFLGMQKTRSVAVLSDPSSQVFRDEFGKQAGTAIQGWTGFQDSAQVPNGAKSDQIEGEMRRLAKNDPQAILAAIQPDGRGELAAALSKLPQDVRRKTFVLGHYGSPTTVKASGDVYPGGIIAGTPDHPSWDNGCTGSGCNQTQPPHAAWVDKISARAKVKGYADYPPYAIQIYVSLQFLDEAARKSGSADAPSLANALRGLALPTSPLGPIAIDARTGAANRGDFFGAMVIDPNGGWRMDPKAVYVRPD